MFKKTDGWIILDPEADVLLQLKLNIDLDELASRKRIVLNVETRHLDSSNDIYSPQ